MIVKYPVITGENFEEFTKKHVRGWGGDLYFVDLPIPVNAEEFRECTKALYGVELDVYCFAYPDRKNDSDLSASYEIVQEEKWYSSGEVYQLWVEKYGSYTPLKILLNTVFGFLSCGGVASRHYGQTKADRKTWCRVMNWDSNNQVKYVQSHVRQAQDLKEIFGREEL